MSSPHGSHKTEQPNTYFVQDRQSKEELTRLTIQERLVTTAMGGVLAEQADPSIFRRVLDIGCGPGGWIVEAAQTYPTMSLVGIDISQRMIDYAHAQAAAHNVADRIELRVMDALRTLDFPSATFDLVNLRFGVSYIRTWDWPRLLGEIMRVLRPGGVIRLTEPEIIQHSNSVALTRLYEMLLCALYRSGHLYAQESNGLTVHLEPLLTRYGCQQVAAKTCTIAYQGGTEEGQSYYEATKQGTLGPFIQKWGCAPENYDDLFQQALNDMQQPTFHITWNILTVWGTSPRPA